MRDIAVVYRSICGHTKKYAEWIANELDADIFDEQKVKVKKLDEYKCIVFGGGIYASGIIGSSLITNNFEMFSRKKLVVFAVGLTENPSAEEFERILIHNFSFVQQKLITSFYLRGGIDYKKMPIVHKAMLASKKASIEKKEDKSEEEKLFLKTYGIGIDFTDVNSIKPIVDHVKSLYIKD